MIATTAQSAIDRPHQLLLTGDQIYADDVADTLLLALSDAGETLLGWAEAIPRLDSGTYGSVDLPPFSRNKVLFDAGFTSDDLQSHLMFLGEYLAMYLFAWSPTLWPPELPTFDDLKGEISKLIPRVLDDAEPNIFREKWQHSLDGGRDPDFFLSEVEESVVSDRSAVNEYLGIVDNSTVPPLRNIGKVRRALANVPTFMICDDHEVTDDWNMTQKFCQGVYGKALGQRVVQNALVAYSLCQAWGNTPEQLDDASSPPAGRKLLNLVKLCNGSPTAYTNAAPAFMQVVGVHDATTLAAKKPYRVFHDLAPLVTVNGVECNPAAIDFHYTIEGTAYKILVSDTRTWRAFPGAGVDSHPDLLPSLAVLQQLHTGDDLKGRLLLVVVTTNMPPVASIRLAARIPQLGIYKHDLYDSWELGTRNFDQMIAQLSDVKNLANPGQIILLSGDVHFSFSSRLAYWADERLGDTVGQGRHTELVFAQLVCSALKNQTDDTLGMQSDGYTYSPHWYADLAVPDYVPEGYAGWNTNVDAFFPVGTVRGRYPLGVRSEHPTLGYQLDKDVTLDERPDWHYRLDYLVTNSGGNAAPPPPTIVPGPLSDPMVHFRNFDVAHKAALALLDAGGELPECVGHNNLGEITFYWQPQSKRVFHTLRWQEWRITGKMITLSARYEISLEIDDLQFPMIKAGQEP
jgi:hypothetical protein